MKGILIDTNIYSHAMRGDTQVVYVLQRANKIGISAISIGELLSGFKEGSRERENKEELEQFLDSPRVSIYPVDEDTAKYYSEILNGLRKAGNPIPANDIWIAATTFQHGLILFTKDTHFKNVPGLILE
jgi:tRNA(fMet)-specific endonuclease VapC